MPRLIDADSLADRLDALAYDDWNQGVSVSWADAFKVFAEMVRDERVVETERHGHWENYLKEGLRWKCSECGSRFETPYHYCPNCGAKMDEALQGEEPEINPCRGCEDYDGQGGCLSKGGCAERREDGHTER